MTASITVTADTAAPYIRLTANITSGLSPLTTTLRIDASFPVTESNLSYTRPASGSVEILPGTAVDEYDILLTGEGVYTIYANAPDELGTVYTDSLVIILWDLAQMDTQLKAKWANMKSALTAQDVEGAAAFFHEATREKYQSILSGLYDQLPQIATDMQEIRLVYIKNDLAEYRISRMEEIDGQPREITYFIYFVKGDNGLWKIEGF